MARKAWIVVVACVIAVAACTGPASTRASPPTRKPASHQPGSAGPVQARCPVTVPRQTRQPQPGAGNGLRWYGNDVVWVQLSVDGVLGTDPQQQRPWYTKVPWWKIAPGALTIRAQPVGSPVSGFHGDVPSGYAPTGWQPSGLYWPRLGCWRVTGTLAGRSLTFTVWVKAGYS